MVQRDYFVALGDLMSSQLFNYYKDQIARCQSPAELLDVSKKVNDSSLRKDEKCALALAAVFAAKWFDKKGYLLNDEVAEVECSYQE